MGVVLVVVIVAAAAAAFAVVVLGGAAVVVVIVVDGDAPQVGRHYQPQRRALRAFAEYCRSLYAHAHAVGCGRFARREEKKRKRMERKRTSGVSERQRQ